MPRLSSVTDWLVSPESRGGSFTGTTVRMNWREAEVLFVSRTVNVKVATPDRFVAGAAVKVRSFPVPLRRRLPSGNKLVSEEVIDSVSNAGGVRSSLMENDSVRVESSGMDWLGTSEISGGSL